MDLFPLPHLKNGTNGQFSAVFYTLGHDRSFIHFPLHSGTNLENGFVMLSPERYEAKRWRIWDESIVDCPNRERNLSLLYSGLSCRVIFLPSLTLSHTLLVVCLIAGHAQDSVFRVHVTNNNNLSLPSPSLALSIVRACAYLTQLL